jgi:hypothetical protein
MYGERADVFCHKIVYEKSTVYNLIVYYYKQWFNRGIFKTEYFFLNENTPTLD